MDERIKKLKQLHSLQQVQNEMELRGRVENLEESVISLTSIVEQLHLDLSNLLMEFNRDHIKLGAQDAPYRSKE